jgi:hypothetical protein
MNLATIKRYKYFFQQLNEPIVIEAESRNKADSILISLNNKSGNWLDIKDLFDLRVESLVIGVSNKKGWMEEKEYLKIVINNKKQHNES